MGLLVAQIVALHTEIEPLHIGRHQEKLDLVRGTRKLVLGAENKLPEDVKQVRLSAFPRCNPFPFLTPRKIEVLRASTYSQGFIT